MDRGKPKNVWLTHVNHTHVGITDVGYTGVCYTRVCLTPVYLTPVCLIGVTPPNPDDFHFCENLLRGSKRTPKRNFNFRKTSLKGTEKVFYFLDRLELWL